MAMPFMIGNRVATVDEIWPTTVVAEHSANGRTVTLTHCGRYDTRPWRVDINPPLKWITGEYPSTHGGEDDARESYADACLRVAGK